MIRLHLNFLRWFGNWQVWIGWAWLLWIPGGGAAELEAVPGHQTQKVAGWTVHVSERLTAEEPAATQTALKLLETQLDEIRRVVPAAAVQQLEQVPLWFSPEYPDAGPRAEYHPGVEWLRENNRNPAMVKGVEFTNIRIFPSECRRMPNFALHELAHAYHDRYLPDGFGHPEVAATFERARAGGKYERVAQRSADGSVTEGRSYALTNPMEYFAESSEAYFSTNDFFPFNREELVGHDPAMAELLARLWSDTEPAEETNEAKRAEQAEQAAGAVSSEVASEWPQFRGRASNAHAPDPPTPLRWSDTENVAWKVPVPGLGWSSPVVAKGRVFLTTAVEQGKGLSLRALAFDVQSGQALWEREVFSVAETPAIHKKNSHASPTPIVHGDSVVVHFGALGTARLACADGAFEWSNQELKYPPVHGSGGSPFLYRDRLFVVCDGSSSPFVAALDWNTGQVAWKTPRAVAGSISHSFVTPLVTEVDGRGQLLAPGPDHCAAYDVETGRELWRVLAPGWSVVPQPTVGHGLVIYNHDYDHPELLAVKLGGQGDITESHIVWRLKKGAPSTPTPLLVGNDLYVVSDSGIATCLDARSGEQHWSERLAGNYSASPVLAQGRVLFLDEDGRATWVKLGPQFEVLGTNEVSGRTLATPAFVGGAMYLRTDEHLYKIAK